MKKMIIIGLVLFLSLFSAISISNAEDFQFYTISSKEGEVMTATADTNGMKVATLKTGTRVKLVRQEASWSKIEYNGRLGWVRSEAVKPFDQDMLPVYSSYYKLLHSTDHIIYALVNDFTQDGIEDLYVITDSNPSKGQYVETIYSGDTVIYQKNLKHGLSVLKDATDYYLFHHTQTNSEKKYKLSDLNEQAKTDYYEASQGKSSYEITANTYLKSYFIVQSGNGKVTEQTLTHEQVASKDYYGSDNKNEYDESIYLENYSLSSGGKTQMLLEKDFNELYAKYEKAKGAKIIYSDDYKSASLSDKFSFDLKRAEKEVFDLAANVTSPKTIEVLSEEMEPLKLKLAQSVILEMPYEKAIQRNATTMVKNVENGIRYGLPGYDASYFTRGNVEFPQDGMEYIDRAPIDTVIYDFYGTKVNADEFNNLASVENRFLDTDVYQYPVEEQATPETYTYRQLQGIEKLETGYDVLQFTDYEMPVDVIVSESNENALIAGEKVQEGYVVFKRLPFKSGVKWVYVDTVSNLQDMNEDQYKTYENTLSVVQKFIGEQQIGESEEGEELIVASVAIEQAKNKVEKHETSMSWGFLTVIMLLFLGAGGLSYYFYRKKYE